MQDWCVQQSVPGETVYSREDYPGPVHHPWVHTLLLHHHVMHVTRMQQECQATLPGLPTQEQE